ncbi:hypothetical protein CMK11_16715 [Candidatus Poribacteria bacterium]|nr:hypothetical protein [Candidatus Poribacteria bacterium]
MHTGLEYDFRYDPMRFATESDSLQAALVRRVVLRQPRAGDDATIEAHFQEILAGQHPDGAIDHVWIEGREDTVTMARHLLEMGCPEDRPELARAAGVVRRQAVNGEHVAARELCMLGFTDIPAVQESLAAMVATMGQELEPSRGCPGFPKADAILALWAGRELVDADDAIADGLSQIADAFELPGGNVRLGFYEPWQIVNMVAIVDDPAATRLARRLAPMLLRLQETDGSWGQHHWDAQGKYSTVWAFQALAKHGLLDELLRLPPLPADWNVVRSIPAQCEEPLNIACADGKLWLLDARESAALQISPEDATVLRRVKLPVLGSQQAFAATGDAFYSVAPGDAGSTVHELDMETGEVRWRFTLRDSEAVSVCKVGDRLVFGDGWSGGAKALRLDDTDADPENVLLPVAMPLFLCAHGDEMWAVGHWSPFVVRTNMRGELLDWGERPFGRNPLAWDGHVLWALDREHRRICVIEKRAE